LAEFVRVFCKDAMRVLNERREAECAAACAPLDVELVALEAEESNLSTKSQGFLERLASAERVKQFERDTLIMQGLDPEAAAKLAELDEIKAAPAKIEARRVEIAARVAEIESEKKAALRVAAENFKEASITLIRGAETGLAAIFDGTRDALNNLETQLGSTVYYPAELTAPDRSNEWTTLHRLYSGRVR
jgi:hypothetical protein